MKNVTIMNNVLLRAGEGWKDGIYENAGLGACRRKAPLHTHYNMGRARGETE